MAELSAASHHETLDRIIAAGASGVAGPAGDPASSPRQMFGDVSDDFWLWAFTEGYRTDPRLRSLVPSFPPEEVQLRFAGAAGDDTMRDAFGIYRLVKSIAEQHSRRPLQSVLEFGCGWGRIIRFFLRDIEPRRLWGIDCLPVAIQTCTETNAQGQFRLVDPFPPTFFAAGTFDLVYAYSVFSHLSEDAHLQWLAEFERILQPGGLAILTTRPREFILDCAAARARHEDRGWAQGAVLSFQNTPQALARYDRGEFMYEALGGGDVLDKSFFGETCIPRQYVEQHWVDQFELLDYIDDRQRCQQNVIVVRKA